VIPSFVDLLSATPSQAGAVLAGGGKAASDKNTCPHAKKDDPLHPCPYHDDVNNANDPEYCNCCEECTSECSAEI